MKHRPSEIAVRGGLAILILREVRRRDRPVSGRWWQWWPIWRRWIWALGPAAGEPGAGTTVASGKAWTHLFAEVAARTARAEALAQRRITDEGVGTSGD